jgi:hypothetical protein
VEFIEFDEAADALEDVGVGVVMIDDDHLGLETIDEELQESLCRLHLAAPDCACPPEEGARVIALSRDSLADAVENMIGQLGLSQVLLLPVGKWRSVFDAVAFSLASNEAWQEIDAMATVELNTRDPLLCEPGDYHTLRALVDAIYRDASTPEQGLVITSVAKPFFAEILPEGAIRVTVGNQAMADEIVEGLAV